MPEPCGEGRRWTLWQCDKGHVLSEEAVKPHPGRGEEKGHCPYPCMADCEPLSDAMPVAEHEAVVQELRAGALADLRAKDERLTYWLGRALGAEAEVERLCSENRSTLATKIDLDRLNEARWMACNRRYPPETPSMERASTLADEVVRSYLGISPERWIELFHSAVPATG